MTSTPRLAAQQPKRFYDLDPHLAANADFPDQCVAPKTRGTRCSKTSVPDAPFPMCLQHMAEILTFVHATSVLMTPEQREARRAQDQRAEDERAACEAGIVYYVRVGELVKIGTTRKIQRRVVHPEPRAVGPHRRST